MKKTTIVGAAMTLVAGASTLGGAAQAADPGVTTVTVGSFKSGVHPVSGMITKQVYMAAGSFFQLCNMAQVPTGGAAVRAGAQRPDVSRFSSVNFSGCFGSGGGWKINSTSAWTVRPVGAASAALDDKLAVRVEGIQLSLTEPGCVMGYSGSVAATFDEAAQTLTIDHSRTDLDFTVARTFSGCFGAVQPGNGVDLRMTLKLDSPDGPIRVS